jgi:crotonobetainyl-CoA:carnitine CoA-transferase CaiB-like acyl-CoA transferase
MSWPPMPGASTLEPGPLDGLRVLDFSSFLPGPYATQMLADLGADVIKVEPPHGDEARHLAYGLYAVANRNKRGIVANLKNDRDRTACLELAGEADVVVEGWRPGVAARLGVSYEDVRRLRPDVVYCSISGYGQTGPNRDRPGHDLNFLAVSGGLAFSAHWGEAPRRSGVPVADLAASTHAVVAILSALREHDRTGEGCHLDVAIADATLAFASPRGGPGFVARNEQQLGVYAVNDLYTARDGALVAVAAVESKFWRRLRDALTAYRPELQAARFDDEDGRREHGDELKGLLASAFRERDADDWVEIFAAHDVPVERVATLAEAAHSAQAIERGVVVSLDGEEQVVFPVLRNGRVMGRFRHRAPALGEHTSDVLELTRGPVRTG